MKTIVTTLFILGICLSGFAQIQIKRQNSVTNPLEDSLVRSLAGFGIALSNISTNLSPNCYANGTFRATGSFPIKDGMIMTTGQADTIGGANNGGIVSRQIPYTDTVSGTSIGRQMLKIVLASNGSTSLPTDVSTIKFDIVPIGDSLKFKYIFASEEYNQFVCSNFNDVFGFFIKGEGIAGDVMFNGTAFEGYHNIAIIPGTNLPVSINTLNNGLDNDPDQLCNVTPQGIASFFDNTTASSSLYDVLKFNGMSIRLTAETATVPCTPYTLVLAIADVSDRSYDSGVFLESGSMVSGDYCTFVPFSNNQMNDTITNCQPGKLLFKRCPSHVADKWVIHFKSQGTAVANVDFKMRAATGELVNLPDSIVLLPGMSRDSIMLEPIGNVNEMKKVLIRYQNLQIPFINGQPNFMPGTTELVLMPNVKIAGRDLTSCWFDTGSFRSQFLSLPNTTYQWWELVDGQLVSSPHLSCNQCANPIFMMDSLNRTFVVRSVLQNTTCERLDTVVINGLRFIMPVYSATPDQISITNPQPGYTYEWRVNQVLVPGSNITSVTVLPTDSVDLKVTAPNGCSASYRRSQMIGVSNAMLLSQNGYRVYPNPAFEHLVVSSSDKQPALVEIFDMTGRLKASDTIKAELKIPVNGFTKGTYLIRITGMDGRGYSQKVVVGQK